MAKSFHRGIINQILSGDSVQIRGRAVNGPPTKITVILSNISSPKLGRRQTAKVAGTEDEAFAWEARELLRTKCIGKDVVYQLEKEVRPGTSYGTVFLDNGATKENLACLLVSSGYALLRQSNNPEITGTEYYQSLLAAQATAKESRVGKWGAQPIQRKVVSELEEVREFANGNIGTPIKSIVEFVRDGSSMQVLMMVPSENGLICYSSMILLTGLRTNQKAETEEPDSLSLRAHFFVESRMLQREVNVVIERVNQTNLTGSVIHPNGNIGTYLLQEGLAHCMENGLPLLSEASVPGGAAAYRNAEQKAKMARKGMWHDWQPPKVEPKAAAAPAAAGGADVGKPFQGMVVDVGMGDNITVKCPDGVTRKLFLAHLKAPRLAPQGEGAAAARTMRPLYDVPYAYEAREFLRKRLIGKKATVTIEYVQPKQPNSPFDERYMVTVLCSGQNIAEGLVSKGLATVFRPRFNQNEDQGAANRKPAAGKPESPMDLLIAAEETAKTKGLGMHNATGETGKIRVTETARNPTMSKQVFPSLKRAGRLPGIVEFVTSPSRIRVFLTRDNMLVTVLLEGIVCPQTARDKNGVDEPFSQEALNFVREHFTLRDVEVEIENMDRVGNFIGWVYFTGHPASADGDAKKKKKPELPSGLPCDNLAVSLVAKGFGTRWSPTYSGAHAAELSKAEEKAKSSKAGQWSRPEFVKQMEEQSGQSEMMGGEPAEAAEVVEETSAVQNGNSAQKAPMWGRKNQENLYMEELAGLNGMTEAKRKELTKAENVKRVANRKLVEVTFIPCATPGSSGLRFFVQFANHASDIEHISSELNRPGSEFVDSLKSAAADYVPKPKEMCAAQFSADDCWYRARVLRVDTKASVATVLFVDFGNTENVALNAKRLAPLPAKLAKQQALATEFRLAAVQLPPGADEQAVVAFGRLLESKQLFLIKEHDAVACGKEDTHPVPSASLMLFNANEPTTDVEKSIDAANYLIGEGLVYLEPFRQHICRLPPSLLQRYVDTQNEAKEGRKNIWRFGDAREDLVSDK